jgi:aminoglycoside/choline kinase family phosphotransferase
VRDDFGSFYRDFEWMGLQRHLKVLGIFARLCYRDGKDRYLGDLPLVLRYTERTVNRYRELAPLARLIDDVHERRAAAGMSF